MSCKIRKMHVKTHDYSSEPTHRQIAKDSSLYSTLHCSECDGPVGLFFGDCPTCGVKLVKKSIDV